MSEGEQMRSCKTENGDNRVVLQYILFLYEKSLSICDAKDFENRKITFRFYFSNFLFAFCQATQAADSEYFKFVVLLTLAPAAQGYRFE